MPRAAAAGLFQEEKRVHLRDEAAAGRLVGRLLTQNLLEFFSAVSLLPESYIGARID